MQAKSPVPGAPTPGTAPDQTPGSLYKKRVKVHPKSVKGPFRRFKWIALWLTLAIYYITPWLRWDRGPYAPDQMVLVDLAHRRFFFGPIEIWPQEFYYVAGLLIMAGVGLFLVTTTVGRAWCGFACPQTVWTDLFMKVEQWIEGDRNARMRLDKAPMSASKFAKRSLKHLSWLMIAVLTGGAWVFYFTDAPTLLGQLLSHQAPLTAYASIAFLTFTTYSLAGLMREQVCTYMCPWPRIQSAMLDEDSLTVTYKAWRGEARGSVKEKQEAPDRFGDCIDCMACVNVCPTGIDIRNGPQLECITCALCVDACNDIMHKLGREPDLIGYSSLKIDAAEQRGEQRPPLWRTMLRPRVLVYFSAWAAIGIAMLVVFSMRANVDLLVSQGRNPLYVQLSNGDLRNSYTVKILNKQSRPRTFALTVEGLQGATLGLPVRGIQDAKQLQLGVRADGVDQFLVQVRSPSAGLAGSEHKIRFKVRALTEAKDKDAAKSQAEVQTRFSSPEGGAR